jgi:cytochrome bd ubiquinol oxidase subunit I
MSALDLARWQFGTTTIYHFIFVPLSIGLSLLIAIMQTVYYRTGNTTYRTMVKFWGKLFLLNFAMGVVTGLVQEFQFGMNWSSYSRYVGDIFGAPLAAEALLAFFVESTFLGLWIFGWDKLSRGLHLATIWLVAIGTEVSAYFILAANSWMQHPVGYIVNRTTGRAELRDFPAVLFNVTQLVSIPHVLLASYLTAGLFVIGISGYHLLRRKEVDVFRGSAQIALVISFISAVLIAFVGHVQAQVMTQQQPMKMAAAEALYRTESGAHFSIFAIGDLTGQHLIFDVTLPNLLSVLATNDWNGTVLGIDDVQAQERQQFGPGDYTPIVPVTYWTFRLMIGVAFALIAFTAWGLYLMRRRRLERTRSFLRLAPYAIALPFLANTTGWMFTEMGRQPWAVYGLIRTADGVSPSVGVLSVGLSMVVFTLLYGGLAAVEGYLLWKFARAGPTDEERAQPAETEPAFAY